MAPRPSRLSPEALQAALLEIPGWTIEGNRLRRRFRFTNFVDAFGFMTRCAFAAEALNHHPDWTNVYNRVDVALWTHDAGGLTELDFKLAQAMNEVASSGGESSAAE